MNTLRRRWARAIGAGMIALGLSLTLAPTTARAQDDMGEESSGRPLDGYFGTGILAFIALYIIGKSARR